MGGGAFQGFGARGMGHIFGLELDVQYKEGTRNKIMYLDPFKGPSGLPCSLL